MARRPLRCTTSSIPGADASESRAPDGSLVRADQDQASHDRLVSPGVACDVGPVESGAVAGDDLLQVRHQVQCAAEWQRADFEGKQLGGGGQPVGGSKSGSDLGIVEGGQEVRQGRDTQVTDQCEGLFVIRDAELDEAPEQKRDASECRIEHRGVEAVEDRESSPQVGRVGGAAHLGEAPELSNDRRQAWSAHASSVSELIGPGYGRLSIANRGRGREHGRGRGPSRPNPAIVGHRRSSEGTSLHRCS